MTVLDKTVCRLAAAVLDELTHGLRIGESRRLDRELGFMAVHVECVRETAHGAMFSIAHYAQVQGDLVPDPDVVFIRGVDGWTPFSFQDAHGLRVAIELIEGDAWNVDEKELRALISFVNHWMRNIQVQQGLSPRRPR